MSTDQSISSLAPDLRQRLGCLIGNVIDEDLSIVSPHTNTYTDNVLFLHFDGLNHSTLFIDSGPNNHIFTSQTGVEISTDQSVLGGSSASFAGLIGSLENRLITPDSNDWYFGIGDFTIDFYVRFNAIDGTPSVPAPQQIVGQWESSSRHWEVTESYNGYIGLGFTYDSLSINYASNANVVVPNVWYHIIIGRVGTTARLIINDVVQVFTLDSGVVFGTNDVGNVNADLIIGRVATIDNPFNGYLDEFKIYKGASNSLSTYQSENKSWLEFPIPRVRKIDTDGIETTLLPDTNYTTDLVNGRVILTTPVSVSYIIRADYDFNIFTDDDIRNLLDQSAKEIKTLIHRNLDLTAIPDDYREVILKRAYTNAFKCLIQPTYNFFRVNVGGRDIDKTNLVDTMQKIITINEEVLQKEINALRNFNQTNRFE